MSRRKANAFPDPLRDFWDDWDYRQEKLTGVPRHFLTAPSPGGVVHPIPIYKPLPKPKERKESL